MRPCAGKGRTARSSQEAKYERTPEANLGKTFRTPVSAANWDWRLGKVFIVFCETDFARRSFIFCDGGYVKKPWFALSRLHAKVTRRASPDVDRAAPRIRWSKDPTDSD